MSQTPFQRFPSRCIARRDAVKIIAGASAAIALSPSMALADSIEEDAQADQTLMNSWRYDQGELIEDEATEEDGISTYGSGSAFGKDAEGNWCNSQGNPIPGALLRGVDVSEHQGVIDWRTVKNSGSIDYAIIRCGFGSNYSNQDDKQFFNNVRGCLDNGIPFGIYLYSYACSTSMARSEAQHVLRLLDKAGLSPLSLNYPVYLDLEQQDKSGKPSGINDKGQSIALSNSALADITAAFCSTVEAIGYAAGVYANTNWWTNFLTGSTYNKWSKWVAQYNTVCTYSGIYDMWQASSKAQVPGIGGNVDINFDFLGIGGNHVWSRIFGQDQLDTMRSIAQTGWSSSSTVVVATQNTYWDALTASALAGIHDCPILLTSSSSLSTQTKSIISQLGATTAYVVGGPIAIASAVDEQIKNTGCGKVIRVYGDDQQGTARAIAEQVVNAAAPDTCIIATSWKFQDALSVAPYAYWKKAPIYLCDDGSNKLSAETEKAIKAGGYKSAIIVGGPIAVDSGVEARLENCGIPSVKRIYGETEYETSAAIADWETKCGMSVNKMALATGNTYYDALAGGALCGRNGSVLVIEKNSNRTAITNFIAPRKSEISSGYVFGGPIAVSSESWLTLLRTQTGRI